MTWYNKYRPTSFEDVVGQELVKQVLEHTLLTGKVKQAYLFTGPKGTGKTTLARIFASRLNEVATEPQAEIDIVEMDAATRNKVENIRELIDSVAVPPIAGKYKIYIMDEVHMLSTAAWNSLLKTLEEPPSYFVFIMCTTNPEKIIPTVLSRLTKLSLSSHRIANIVSRLRYIADLEKMSVDNHVLELIAKRSNGGQRDAINLLETLYGYGLEHYDEQNSSKLLGLLPKQLLQSVSMALKDGKINVELISELQTLDSDGETFLGQLLDFLLDVSLEGDHTLDSLIEPVANILSLRLPLNSPTAAIAMLHSRLNPGSGNAKSSGTNPTDQNPSDSQPPDPVNRPIDKNQVSADKIVPLDNESETSILPQAGNEDQPLHSTLSISKNPQHKDTNTHLNKAINSDPKTPGAEGSIDKKEFQQFLASMHSDPLTFVTLKLMLHDLQMEDIQEGEITLSVSNNIFLVQLNNIKTIQFLSSRIREKFGRELKLNTVLRTSRVKSKISNYSEQTYSDSSQTSDMIDTHATNTKSYLTETQNSYLINNAPAQPYNDSDKKEYFYEIYKKAPENFTNKEIKIYDKPIDDPKTSYATTTELENKDTGDEENTSEWDELISEFELE